MLGATLNQYIYPIFYEVQQASRSLWTWFTTFLGSLLNDAGRLVELRPLFYIGVAVSVIFAAIYFIKKVVWGS